MNKISKILVPLDFSACSRSALDFAVALGTQLGATIHAVYVSDVPQFRKEPRVASEKGTTSLREFALEDAQAELSAFLDTLDAGQRSKISTSLDVGQPRACILDHAKRGGYDLIVMGTHGRTGRAHSLAGSVAESVVRSAPCPVLTVREPG